MFLQFREIKKGEFFVIGSDCSMGAGDWCVSQFLSKNYKDVPLVYRTKGAAPEMTDDLQPILERLFDITGIKPVIGYERNNGGAFEMERLGSLNRLGKYKLFEMYENEGLIQTGQPRVYGWDTNTATRPKMLSELKQGIDSKLIKIYDEETIKEMYSFIKMQANTLWKAQAEKGMHDDHVVSLAIAWQMYLSSPSVLQIQQYRTTGDLRQFPSVERLKRQGNQYKRFSH